MGSFSPSRKFPANFDTVPAKNFETLSHSRKNTMKFSLAFFSTATLALGVYARGHHHIARVSFCPPASFSFSLTVPSSASSGQRRE
jgi:hypothetical protein